jgi:hypothetical protein
MATNLKSDPNPIDDFKQASANAFQEQGEATMDFHTRAETRYVNHG